MKGGRKGERASGAAAEGSSGEAASDPHNDTGTAVGVIDEPATDDTPAAPDAVESTPVAPYVAAGFGGLALALGAGFLWYRRRLP